VPSSSSTAAALTLSWESAPSGALGRDVGQSLLARERLELRHAARGRGARFLEGVRRASLAAGEDREVISAADVDGTFDVDGAVFNEA